MHLDIIFNTKLDSGFFPCSAWSHKIKECDIPKCQNCGHPTENPLHLLNCSHEEVSQTRFSALTDTFYWINKVQTDPQLSSTMINWIINAGQKSFVDCVPDNAMPLLRDAAQQQDDIGPTSFIAGKISLL